MNNKTINIERLVTWNKRNISVEFIQKEKIYIGIEGGNAFQEEDRG